jgi:hypothetical protein
LAELDLALSLAFTPKRAVRLVLEQGNRYHCST